MKKYFVAVIFILSLIFVGSSFAIRPSLKNLRGVDKKSLQNAAEGAPLIMSNGRMKAAESGDTVNIPGTAVMGTADIETLNVTNPLEGVFIPRYDTSANLDLITLQAGEIAIASDTRELRIGDGVTAGGAPISVNLGSGYGLRWNSSTDEYDIGLVIGGYFVTSSNPIAFPIQEQMKRVVLEDEGTVAYELCPTDSTKKADCSTASVLDGTDGQVMVQIPKFHYIQVHDGDYRYFLIGVNQFSFYVSGPILVTSTVHEAFYKGGSSIPSNYMYIGAYELSMYDDSETAMTAVASIATDLHASGDKGCSVSGQYPKTNEARAEFRSMAESRGTGWHVTSSYEWAAVQLLYLTEHSDFDSQTKIGPGRTDLSNGDWVASEVHDGNNYGYIGICGLSNSDGNASGNTSNDENLTVAESSDYMSYRGIENLYGNIRGLIGGANAHYSAPDLSLYLAADYTTFVDDTSTGYSLVGAFPLAPGFATDLMDAVGVWPSAVGGSSSTYLTDSLGLVGGTWHALNTGGSATSDTAAGIFSVYVFGPSSTASTDTGARLSF